MLTRLDSKHWLASIIWTTILTRPVACTASETAQPQRGRRSLAGDTLWPTEEMWSSFNASIGGKLIRAVPIAAVCHRATYEKQKCDTLRDSWFFPETHLSSASLPMLYPGTNDSCNPFSKPDAACTEGTYVAYAVNATCEVDFHKTIKFVKDNNVRLVIRNTGHDYLGKSTGAHALALCILRPSKPHSSAPLKTRMSLIRTTLAVLSRVTSY